MNNRAADMSPNTAARTAGLLYLIIFCLGIFAELFVRQDLIIPGDAVTTVNNILASESLFRLSVVSDLIRHTLLLLLPLVLYKLLKPVNKDLALIMLIFALAGVPVEMLNTLNFFAALQLVSGAGYLTAFGADQLHAQAIFFLELHNSGAYITQFLGLWLLPLGYLVFKSGFLPRILGLWLMIGSLCYVADVVLFVLIPDSNVTLGLLAFLGELVFAFWLLIKGVNVEVWRRRILESG